MLNVIGMTKLILRKVSKKVHVQHNAHEQASYLTQHFI